MIRHPGHRSVWCSHWKIASTRLTHFHCSPAARSDLWCLPLRDLQRPFEQLALASLRSIIDDLIEQTDLESFGLLPSPSEERITEMRRVGDTLSQEGSEGIGQW
jgi:hypothetical protein